jgi:signal transduction histidine kinase
MSLTERVSCSPSERLAHAMRHLATLPVHAADVLSESEVVDSICAAARHIAQSQGACVVFREGELVHYAREDSIAPLWAGQKFPLANCISGWSIVHAEPVTIEDIYNDPRIPVEYYKDTYVKSLAMQPIDSGHPIGAIGVYWAERHAEDPEQLEQLAKLADIASLLISNVRLRAALEAKRQEAQQRAAEAATHAEAARSRDELLATVSHELRTPLDAVLGWTRMLQIAPDAEASKRAVEIIERNARAQAALLDDLIDVSRIVAGKLELHMRPVELAAVVSIAIEGLLPEAARKHVEIDYTQSGGPVFCNGDAPRLQQVVRNLVSNALKFTPAGGRVEIELSRAADTCRLEVRDNGVGIEPRFLPFVFDRFRQAEQAREARQPGLGLGLAIAREIVAAHGGEIACHSEGKNRGATFTVTLPPLR